MKSKLLTKLPIRMILIVPFVLQIILTVGLVGYLSLKNGQDAVNEMASQLRTEIANRTQAYLHHHLEVPHRVNQINAAILKNATIEATQFLKLEYHFWQQLQIFGTASYISLGNTKGEFVGVERVGSRQFNAEVKDLDVMGNDLYTFSLDEKGKRTKGRVTSKGYDCRVRPWYKAAVRANKPTWSKIYELSSKEVIRLGVCAVQPVYDQKNRFIGVLGTDIIISHLSDFLKKLKIGSSGKCFIIERDGMLVASSSLKTKRIKATKSTNPVIRATSRHLAKYFQGFEKILGKNEMHFKIEGERQFAQVLPFRDGRGIDWLIVVVVPELDFMGQINSNTKTTIALCVIALMISIFIGVWTARWITRPILDLNNAARNIARGKWQQLEIDRADELGELTNSFNSMARQLGESFETLEQKVEERTAELAKSNQAKSTFIANMSHELRSPLNAILGFSQLMIRSQTLSSEYRENLSLINSSGEYLLSLINSVLDLSKIEAGKTVLNPTSFDLHRLLCDIEDMFQLRAEDKILQLSFEQADNMPRYVRTDEVKLRQVLTNLLSNAIKFTREGGVVVRAQLLSETDNSVQIGFEVEDTGPGISPDEIDNLFKAFTQTQTGKEVQEGTGLGLAISQKFVQLMGGNISVESKDGAIFKFHICGEKADSPDVQVYPVKRQVVALEQGQPSYRILVVDDKPVNRQLLKKLLQPLGFEVREAENGKEAIEIWDSWEPHLIWMDMRMPIMDGYNATKHIKGSIKGQATAVIALTASVLEEEKAVVLSAGCDDFLRKPFKVEDIFASLHQHLGVKFVYKVMVEQAPKTQDNLLSSMLAPLPVEWLRKVRDASEKVDGDEIRVLLEQLEPKHQSQAETIGKMVENFAFDELIEIIDELQRAENG